MRTTSQADLAVRLRLVIARTARRLRQEAAEELSLSQAAALATIDRHGPLPPSELLARVRTRKDAYLSRRLRDLDADERATLDRAAAILERVLEEDRT